MNYKTIDQILQTLNSEDIENLNEFFANDNSLEQLKLEDRKFFIRKAD